MKRYSILILVFAAILSVKAYSQELFYAEDAYDQAVAAAGSETLTSPQLILCMSMEMVDSGGMPVPIDFDWETGQATMWIFYFVEKDNPEKHTGVIAMKIPFVGIYIIEQNIDDWIQDISNYYSLTTALQKSDLNSERMVTVMTADSDFNAELATYTENSDIFISLFNNKAFPGLTPDKTYWGVIFDPDFSDKVCSMEVESEDVLCANLTSIESNGAENIISIELNNNPVDEVLSFDYATNGKYTVSVIDMLGNTVKTGQFLGQSADLDVSGIQSGAYFLQVKQANTIQTKKFIKR